MAINNTSYVAVGAIVVVIIAMAVYFSVEVKPPMSGKQIHLDSHALFVEVADTPAARELGLSGHAPLAEGQGMLFVFDQDDRWGIWMKDMRFPIDILWADANGKVVTVAPNAAPDSYPQIFYPTSPARYVLEVPAGYAARQGIAEGSQLVL